MVSTDLPRPEPPPPPELPRAADAARVRESVADSADGHASGTSRAGEHEEARSAARQEFAEASRGQGEPEWADIPRQREPEALTPSNDAGGLEQAGGGRAGGEPHETAEPPSTRAETHDAARSASAKELRDAHTDQVRTLDDPARAAEEGLRPEEKREFLEYEQQLIADGRTREVTATGDEYDYQRRHCGDTEFRLTGDESLPSATWADGLNREEALAQDAKYVGSDGPSFYKPDTLPPFLAEQATNDIDIRLSKYRDVAEDPTNPVRGLEIITNDPDAAAFFKSRMDTQNVDGKVTQRE